MRGKRYKKDKSNSKLKNSIINFILIVFIATMIFSGVKIFKWFKENKKNQDILNGISKSVNIDESKDGVDKYNIDFETLKRTNPDTIAWIKVNGTDIEYPVVQTTNNDYYMNHSFDKTYNSSGWVFMDYKNRFDDTDKNMVIFAHNRRDGSMFGTLKNILNEDWQNNKENYIIPLITEKEIAEYQVFSIYRIEKEDYYITTGFKNNNEFQEFIDKIKSRSIKNFGVGVNTDDNILTLSTCANDNRYRVVLHAKKITE